MPQNPGLSREVQEAIQRRAGSAPMLGQVSPQSGAQQVPPPTPQSEMTQASAPPSQDAGTPKAPKYEAQNQDDLIVMALIEKMKNNDKLKKEQMSMQPGPMGGGGKMQDWVSHKIPILRNEGYPPKQSAAIAYSMGREKGYGGGSFNLSPGFEQPMPKSQMQGDYMSGRYSGLNNYGQ